MAETVDTVVRDRQHFDYTTAEHVGDRLWGRKLHIEFGHRRQVVGDEPLPLVDFLVESEHHDWASGDSPQFLEAGERIRPMVHGQQRHPGTEDRSYDPAPAPTLRTRDASPNGA